MGRKFKLLFIIYRNLLKTKSATFNHLNVIIIFFIVYELDTRSRDLNYHFNCLSGGVKLGKNGDPDKYVKTFFDIGFSLRSEFSLLEGSVGKHAISL